MSAMAPDEANTPQKRPRRAPVHYPRQMVIRLPADLAAALEREADATEVSISGAARAAIEAGLPRLKDRRRKARKRVRTGAAE